jgi:hypothetical protein
VFGCIAPRLRLGRFAFGVLGMGIDLEVDTPRAFADLDGWVRHRLRAMQLKHWKRGRVGYRELIAHGMPSDAAARLPATAGAGGDG